MTESVPSSPSPSGDHTLIVIPTYNEMATLPTILGDIWANVPGAHVLIVDDSSPDGTGSGSTTDARARIVSMSFIAPRSRGLPPRTSMA